MSRFMTVTASAGLRARTQPDTTAQIVALIPFQSRVWVVNETPKWAQLVLEVGNVPCGLVWASKDYLASDTTNDEAVRGAEYLLGIHELAHGRVRQAYEMGCRAGMVFDDATEAIALSKLYPNSITMHRVYFTNPPEPAQLLARHGIDINSKTPSDSRVYVRVFNESDSPGYDMTLAGLERRAAYEREILLMLADHAPYAKLVVGGFAHGNPDITNPEVCDLIFKLYGDLWKERKIWIDLHNYSLAAPNNPHDYRYYGDEWLLSRYEKWFTACGLDPTIRQCLSSEAGIEAGHGGVNWANYSDDEFRGYCQYTISVHQRKLNVSGKEYSNPLAAATFFQAGNDYNGAGGWWGYNVDRYINPVFRNYWASATRPTMETPTAVITRAMTLDNVPPVGYHPATKRFTRTKKQ